MKLGRYFIAVLIFIELANAQLFPNLGGQRVGTSVAQFLKIGIGARSVALGEAYVALANDAEALYWNPAGISQFRQNDLFFSYNQWFADIKVSYSGLVYHLNPANSIGAFFASLSCDDMRETTELQPFGTGRYFSYGDMLVGLTYARNMTNKFSFGITLKYLQETMAELTMSGFLFDLGTYYKTGWKSIRFAVAVTNFSNEMGPEGSFTYKNLDNTFVTVSKFQKFSPPIAFRIGVAGELYQSKQHKLTTSVQLNHPNDNSENLNFGAEYWFGNIMALRAGYTSNRVDRDISLGGGINIPVGGGGLRIDYSYANYGRLGFVNQYSMHILL